MYSPIYKREDITPEMVNEAIDYDPLTGVCIWRERPLNHFLNGRSHKIWNTKYSGKKAGVMNDQGYLTVGICGIRFYIHRIAYALANGEWPEHQIDHINGKRDDNRLINLRMATNEQNSQNAKLSKTNSLGLKGVSRCPNSKTFRAQIYRNGKLHHLGTFSTKEEAHAAYAKAAIDLRGEFANLGYNMPA